MYYVTHTRDGRAQEEADALQRRAESRAQQPYCAVCQDAGQVSAGDKPCFARVARGWVTMQPNCRHPFRRRMATLDAIRVRRRGGFVCRLLGDSDGGI